MEFTNQETPEHLYPLQPVYLFELMNVVCWNPQWIELSVWQIAKKVCMKSIKAMYKVNLEYIPQFSKNPMINQWKLVKIIHQSAVSKNPCLLLEQRDWESLKFQFPKPDRQDLAQLQALLRSRYLFNQEEVWDLNHSVLPDGLDPNPLAIILSGVIETQNLCLASQAMLVIMETEQEAEGG